MDSNPTNVPDLLEKMKAISTSDADANQQLEALVEHYVQNLDDIIANTPPDALEAIVHKQESLTHQQEDATRQAVLDRAPRYWPDVERTIAATLPDLWFQAFAVACAERLLARHLQLPVEDQRPFTQTCRRPLDCLWGIIEGNESASELHREASTWLQEYRNGPYHHDLGQDGPGDASHPPASAVIHALECVLEDSVQAAQWTMGCVIETGSKEAQKLLGHRIMGEAEYVEECAHPAFQSELQWLEEIAAAASLSPRDIATLRAQAQG